MKEKLFSLIYFYRDVVIIKDYFSNMNPVLVSLSGVLTAVIIEGDYNCNELNVIGNWLELVGQFILTTASQQQLIQNRGNQKNNSNKNQEDLIIKYLKELVDKLDKL